MLWQPAPVQLPANAHFELGIVLGGMAGYDRYNRAHFGDNADRFIQTANLYHQGIIKKILISGGTGSLFQNEPAEATFLRAQFIENGVKDSDILVESLSKNTYENAVFSKHICDSLQLKGPYVLITSALHMPRSVEVFKKASMNCIPFPCDYKVTKQKFALDNTLLPDASVMNKWAGLLKEIVGLYAYKATGKA